jgi:lipopolysaccharide biosynthesis glycosyltransferase
LLRVLIGYDPNETVAAHVLAHSIHSRASSPVFISQIRLNQVPMWREREALQSTEFSFSRFLVPYMCNYEGYAVFADCDMLCVHDINMLLAYASDRYAVCVAKHEYTPKETEKFLGQVQTPYQRKNWSSVILFNNKACRSLTPQYVNQASGLDLHQFKWLPDEMIGSLPLEWNYLVGEENQAKDPKLIHWTKGGPWFPAYADADFSEMWRSELAQMTSSNPWDSYRKKNREAA